MIYLLYGTEEYQIKQEEKKIMDSFSLDALSIETFDYNQTTLETILEKANTYSLFDEKKILILEHANFFSGKKGNTDTEGLEKYLENPNPQTILIFNVDGEKIDERKKIVKQIKKIGKIIEKNKEVDPYSFVQSLLPPYKMSSEVFSFFLGKIGNKIEFAENEIEKLKLYKGEDLTITKEDVHLLTSKYFNLNLFTFLDDIIYRRKEKCLETYQELLRLNTEPIALLVRLANQIRLMYQVKELTRQGYSTANIASMLNIHPYRAKKVLESAYSYSKETLLKHLNSLAELDFKIKSGKINKDIGLELFILGV